MRNYSLIVKYLSIKDYEKYNSVTKTISSYHRESG